VRKNEVERLFYSKLGRLKGGTNNKTMGRPIPKLGAD
jgi:hypothetical protein